MMWLRKSHFAVTAGLLASTASLFGKLNSYIENNSYQDILIKCLFLGMMIICNAAVWTFFVKALNISNSSLSATVISSATNYVLSALFGCFIFEEATSTLWWFGFFLVLTGLFVICANETVHNDKQIKENSAVKIK